MCTEYLLFQNISSQKIESWIKKKTIVIDKFVKEFLKIK